MRALFSCVVLLSVNNACANQSSADSAVNYSEGVKMAEVIDYYGIDRSFKTIEFGPVSNERALSIVEERYSNLKPKYETVEEAIAETTFGFSKLKDTFIEIYIETPTSIRLKFEYPTSTRYLIFRSVYQKEQNLSSKRDLMEHVRKFFELTTQEYRNYMESAR